MSAGVRRLFHAASLVDQDFTGVVGDVSSAQVPGRSKLAPGDLREAQRLM